MVLKKCCEKKVKRKVDIGEKKKTNLIGGKRIDTPIGKSLF